MNELPKVSLTAAELAAYEHNERLKAHQASAAAQIGVQSVEAELFPNEAGTRAVEISLWVNGREVRATTDHETIQRIMAILVGIEP